MITLITAVPGSGKTLLAITLIEQALKDMRPVYTNINGLVKEKFTNSHLLQDAPDDWRDCPNGSFVVYDEAQQPHLYPSNAQRGKVEDVRLTSLETHRHGGYDLIFITQAPTFVHHHIRKLVGSHIHLYRAKGITGAVKYEWSHTCDSPNDRKEQTRADATPWKFPKEYYSYYTSAVMHTHKFRIPLKILAFFAVVIFAALYIAFKAYGNGGLGVLNSKITGGDGESTNGLPVLAAPIITTPLPSSTWRLKGYVTIGSPSSFGRSLAIIESPHGVRNLDLSLCTFSDDKLFVTCKLDNDVISFNSGNATTTNKPDDSSPFGL